MKSSGVVIDMLSRSRLFGGLNPNQIKDLAAQMRDVILNPGQLLFSRGDTAGELYLVVEGRIRLSVLSTEGRELSLDHALPGELFGEIAALDGAPRSTDATAITKTRLKLLPQGTFQALLETNASTALAAAKLLCARLRDASDNYETIALHPIETRLARLLYSMWEERSAIADRDVSSIALDMSQSELALLIGSTRQRANAALMALEKAGAITRHGPAIQCNATLLAELAQKL